MLLFLLFLLTLLSGFYSGSEAAIFSQDAGRLARMRSEEFSHDLRKTVIGWLRRPERIITGLLLGNLIVNIGMTNIWESWIIGEFGEFEHRHIVLPVVITLYVLTFGEVIPKIIALVFKDAWVKVLQLPLRGWFRFSARFTSPFDRLTARLVKPIQPVSSTFTEAELVEAVRFAEDHGLLKSEEMRMLSRSIAFYHNTVYAAMIPRSQILLLPERTSLAAARKAFLGSRQNFAAIYRKNSNQLAGVIYLRGVVQLQLARKKHLQTKVHPVEFLPASLSLSAALSALMNNRRDIAAVVDEAGAFIGMVTLRGIINHILGASFSPVPQDTYLEKLDNRRYRIAAQMPLDRFNEIFRTNFTAELSETIGGYLLEHIDGFPHGEEEIQIGNLTFRNFEIEDYRLRSFILVVKSNG
jgi:CBS domain containing-hemolysin-like protein